MLATDILVEEHVQILKIVSAIEKATDNLAGGVAVPPEVFEKATFLLADYGENVHLKKEEGFLYKIIEQAPAPEDASVREMLAEVSVSAMYTEHEKIGSYLEALINTISAYKNDQKVKDFVIEASRKFSSYVKEHFKKEEEELFPLANVLVSEEQKEELLNKFKKMKEEEDVDYINKIAEITTEALSNNN